jgi:hypothetical protein
MDQSKHSLFPQVSIRQGSESVGRLAIAEVLCLPLGDRFAVSLPCPPQAGAVPRAPE